MTEQTPECAIDGCQRPVLDRGWCVIHWRRWRKHGDPRVVVACSIDGCNQPAKARGWCMTHYNRWRKRGSPVVSCRIEGCGRPAKTRGWCQMHYVRWLRHGSPMITANDGRASTTSGGYRRLCRSDHPLADANGIVLEHRLVLYAVIGPGAHPCHWCGRAVVWGSTLVADHVDDDKQNNTPANLVPSCSGCNTYRPRVPWSVRHDEAKTA